MAAKTIHKPEYKELLKLLREMREAAKLTQTELGDLISLSQSTVSDIERGTRRIDALEMRDFCKACGHDPSRLMKRYEKAIAAWPLP